jgi:hypothetical protein
MKRRIIVLLLAGGCLLAGLAFGSDYLVFRYRVSRNVSPYETVTVQEYYVIQEKNNRTEYVYKGTEQETCINALFSHAGYAPCWYRRKRTERPVHI